MKRIFLVILFFLSSCIKDYQVNYTIKPRLEVQKKTIGTRISSDINDIICEILKGNDKDAVENFYNITFKNTILELVKQDFLDLGLYRPFRDCEENAGNGNSCEAEINLTNKPDFILDGSIIVDKEKKLKIIIKLLNSKGQIVHNETEQEIIAVNNEYTIDSFNDLNSNVIGLRKISIELFQKMKLISKSEEQEILKGKVETSCLRAASEYYKGRKNAVLLEQLRIKSLGITTNEKNKLSSFIKKYKEKEEVEEKALKRNFGFQNPYNQFAFNLFFWKSISTDYLEENQESGYESMLKKIDPKENYKTANYLSLKKCLGEKTKYLKAESTLNDLSPLLPPIGI